MPDWLMALAIEILLAAAVLLAFGLAAAGRIDGIRAPSRMRRPACPRVSDPGGPARGLLPVVLRGYRMADVDEVLERAAPSWSTPEPLPDPAGKPRRRRARSDAVQQTDRSTAGDSPSRTATTDA